MTFFPLTLFGSDDDGVNLEGAAGFTVTFTGGCTVSGVISGDSTVKWLSRSSSVAGNKNHLDRCACSCISQKWTEKAAQGALYVESLVSLVLVVHQPGASSCGQDIQDRPKD